VESVEKELMNAGVSFQRKEGPHESEVGLLGLRSGIELMFSRGSDPMMRPGMRGLFGFQYTQQQPANALFEDSSG
jgi:hypothetical protein